MQPSSVDAARALLIELGATPRLLRHVALVGEAGELLIEKVVALDPSIRADLIRVGIVIHDAGKILHPRELDQAGAEHEPAGEALK